MMSTLPTRPIPTASGISSRRRFHTGFSAPDRAMRYDCNPTLGAAYAPRRHATPSRSNGFNAERNAIWARDDPGGTAYGGVET